MQRLGEVYESWLKSIEIELNLNKNAYIAEKLSKTITSSCLDEI